jgi:2-(1,2-epoxy-1,2-dihydrophenyl)acetyl-CoA isomerase
MTNSKSIYLEQKGSIAIAYLDDPASRNALSEKDAVQLQQLIESLDDTIRALVITGKGKGFCSGANLSGGDQDKSKSEDRDLGESLRTAYNPLLMTIKNLNIPVITVINGPAAGIGSALALSADFIFMSQEAFILPAFSKIGLGPDGGLSYLLTKSVGRVRAMELLLLDERIMPDQALQWGLVNRIVPAEELMDTSIALANKIASGPTLAYSKVRDLVWRACEADYASQLEAETDAQTYLGRTKDHQIGINAFMKRQKPEFSGK